MTRALAWLLFGWALACLVVALLDGCTCVVNESPAGRAVDGGAELDDSGAESL